MGITSIKLDMSSELSSVKYNHSEKAYAATSHRNAVCS